MFVIPEDFMLLVLSAMNLGELIINLEVELVDKETWEVPVSFYR